MESYLAALWVVVAALIVLLLPGFAWLILFKERDQDLLEKLAGVIGSSISLTAITVLGFFLIDWNISATVLVGLYGFLLVVGIGNLVIHFLLLDHPPPLDPSNHADQPVRFEGYVSPLQRIPPWIYLGFLGIILCLIVALRFYQVRDLVVPSWVDSVHHVLIVQVFLENRGLPDTLNPYLQIPFYYHYSFHSLSAAFSALAQVSPHQSVLWVGQILNAAVALAVYRLGKALWGDWRRAALGMLLVGFVSQMPAYYATWGRYTLLTGLVLLPLAMAIAQDILHKGASRSRLANLALLTAGLLLSHYYAALLFALFLVFCFGQALLTNLRAGQWQNNKNWLILFLGGVIGALLAAPWLYWMWGHAQSDVNLGAVSLSMQAVEDSYFPGYLSYLSHLLGPRRNTIFLIISLGGLPFMLRRLETRAFAIWAIALALLSQPWGFYLAPFRPDHAIIVLFLPAALLFADLIGTVVEWLGKTRIARVAVPAALLIVGGVIAWGAWDTRNIINQSTVLTTPDDLQAISWIDANTPASARFLINVTHWQYGSYRGVDGGWWIGPLTGRETLLPAVLYVMGDLEYVHRINEDALRASELQGCSPDFWELVRSAGFSYIYLNQGKGSLQPAGLQNCPYMELVYQENGVYIYRIHAQSSS